MLSAALGLIAPLALAAAPASAEDQLKMAIGQINNWENQAPTLGQDAGIFKKHGLVLENVGTRGAGETIQAVISGSADIGAGVGVAGVMRAFSKGAPVRILLPAFTGTGDIYWYVKADFADQEPEGRDAGKHHRLFDQRLELEQHRGRLHAGTRLQGQADRDRQPGRHADRGDVGPGRHRLVGAAVRPAGEKDGKIRIIARGSDVPSLRGQTVRTLIVNADALKTKHDAIMRFMQAYRESVDWMYSDPKAVEMYSAKIKKPVELLKASMAKFHPKEALQTDHMADLDGAVRDAVKLKFLRSR